MDQLINLEIKSYLPSWVSDTWFTFPLSCWAGEYLFLTLFSKYYQKFLFNPTLAQAFQNILTKKHISSYLRVMYFILNRLK